MSNINALLNDIDSIIEQSNHDLNILEGRKLLIFMTLFMKSYEKQMLHLENLPPYNHHLDEIDS